MLSSLSILLLTNSFFGRAALISEHHFEVNCYKTQLNMNFKDLNTRLSFMTVPAILMSYFNNRIDNSKYSPQRPFGGALDPLGGHWK